MNIVLLIVDSLRRQSVPHGKLRGTSYFDTLETNCVRFERAYATECWTLSTHVSIFTGLLPSEHGAHFQNMAYNGKAPTLAERLVRDGFHTEIVTRNPVLDGTIPGVTRGFQRIEAPLASYGRGLNPLSIGLALSKPRFRRQIKESGFFHPAQRASREFLTRFAKATLPADEEVLLYALKRLEEVKRKVQKLLLVCNLYDVHAPYPPSTRSIFRPWRSPWNWPENFRMPFVLPSLGSHSYLRDGFRLSEATRRALLGRYESAIALLAIKLERFVTDATAAKLLEDTLLIIASDHGEGFGEHGLYLHDASVFQTHVHVPLYVMHEDLAPATVNDVVSTRHLFGMVLAAAADSGWGGTMLDPSFRSQHRVALAEHYYYPNAAHAAPRFKMNQAAAILDDRKLIRRNGVVEAYDLASDPHEVTPTPADPNEFGSVTQGRHLAA